MEKKKVAILFFGLSRNLNYVYPSIKSYIFDRLKENGFEYDIFIHTNKIFGSYANDWSFEKTDNYVNEDVEKILNPKVFIYDDQDDIVKSIDFNEYYKKLGNWTGMTEDMTKFLIKNMCLALYSKKQITLEFDKCIDDYDYAMIVRPDMKMEELPNDFTKWFDELNENNIIIPDHEWHNGCNDKIIIGKTNIISYCGKLFDDLKKYSETNSIISERYFRDKLREKNINIIPKKIRYKLWRIEGTKSNTYS
jgi:hypothetical protein